MFICLCETIKHSRVLTTKSLDSIHRETFDSLYPLLSAPHPHLPTTPNDLSKTDISKLWSGAKSSSHLFVVGLHAKTGSHILKWSRETCKSNRLWYSNSMWDSHCNEHQVLSTHSHAHLLMCMYMAAFIASQAEMSYLRDYMAPKTWNTHYLALYRIKFPVVGVKYSNPVIPVLRSLRVLAGVTGT